MERKCTECNAPLNGRSDQRFCSSLCRNSYNNRLKQKSSTPYVRQIHNILMKNRTILQRLNKDGKAYCKREILVNKGFNFKYFTHTLETKKGNKYFFCFEEGYLSSEREFVTLVRNEKI